MSGRYEERQGQTKRESERQEEIGKDWKTQGATRRDRETEEEGG